MHRTGRPVLVGTTSVENSEKLSSLFDRAGIKHEVLNAKFVERESEIVAQAGRKGAVTIATNMAGRGTDILLGGNPEIQAWATLKNTYNSRLDVPPEVWRETVGPLEGPMKDEGRKIAEPPPTLDSRQDDSEVQRSRAARRRSSMRRAITNAAIPTCSPNERESPRRKRSSN